ncbi:MAG: degt/dnrj/eryc1/strs aminotransferase [Candidatus Peribacteria bacterium]|nr:degt/dnrj/eryc1/strs aminotransferase [Candidatus Peribacteria bacterium]
MVIHHTFGPLADDQQVRRALGITYTPWKYVHGNSLAQLKSDMQASYKSYISLFASGREALLALLLALDLESDDEIIVQGYTCVVIPNAIHAAGAKAVYCDIDKDTLNMDPAELQKLITPHTRAIICQHTFGIPADTKTLRKICNDRNILLIEDCAHILPDETGPQEIGKLGDFIITSFGRDKAISGVTGGALIQRNTQHMERIRALEATVIPLPWITIQRLISYPLIYRRALPLFHIRLGKVYLHLQKKLGNLVPILTPDEKHGDMTRMLHAMPNACAFFAIAQWRKLKQINNHRRMLTKFYLDECAARGWLRKDSSVYVPVGIQEHLPLQKFPVFMKNAERIRQALKKQDIYLDDGWTRCVVCPQTADLKATGYKKGTDPQAEQAAESILSLPTHPQMTVQMAKKLMDALEKEIKNV